MPAILDDLKICTGSGSLFGPFSDMRAGSPTLYQRCRDVRCPFRARRWHDEPTDLPEPSGDFPEASELCYGCAAVVIPSGSRWSQFFCSACHERVRGLDRSYGKIVIPIGRHSMMNGFALDIQATQSAERIAAFLARTGRMGNRLSRLARWQRALVRRHVRQIGAAGDPWVDLTAYLAMVPRRMPPPDELFAEMCRYFGADP